MLTFEEMGELMDLYRTRINASLAPESFLDANKTYLEVTPYYESASLTKVSSGARKWGFLQFNDAHMGAEILDLISLYLVKHFEGIPGVTVTRGKRRLPEVLHADDDDGDSLRERESLNVEFQLADNTLERLKALQTKSREQARDMGLASWGEWTSASKPEPEPDSF